MDKLYVTNTLALGMLQPSWDGYSRVSYRSVGYDQIAALVSRYADQVYMAHSVSWWSKKIIIDGLQLEYEPRPCPRFYLSDGDVMVVRYHGPHLTDRDDDMDPDKFSFVHLVAS